MNERDEALKIVRRVDSMRLTTAEQQVVFEHMYALLHGRKRGRKPSVPTFLSEFETYYIEYLDQLRKRPPYSTGFPILDQALGGMSMVTVLLGMPGQGKTTFALQVMQKQLESGTPVLFLSFDISRRDIITHLIRRLSGLSFAQIIGNAPGVFMAEHETSLNDDQIARYMSAYDQLREWDSLTRVMSPETDQEVKEETLVAEIESMTREHGRAPLVVVDYLGALAPYVAGSDNSTERIERASHMISRIALTLDAPWLVLSQRSRANYGNAGMDGGKGSGEIEAKAFTVLSLDKRLDVPDVIDYPSWVKKEDQKQKYAAQVQGVERIEALLAGRRAKVSSKLVLHINKDRNALGGGAAGGAINLNMQNGFLVEEPIEPKPVMFGAI
jgi:replicative DNA helicase